MTLQAPETGEFDGDRVAGGLLRHLQTEPGLERTAFDGPPVRLMGGFETLIYAFRLTGAPSELSGPLVVRVFAEAGGVPQARKEAVFQEKSEDVGRSTSKGEKVMGDKGGRKDKGKKEQQRDAKLTLKERRKLKKEKKI